MLLENNQLEILKKTKLLSNDELSELISVDPMFDWSADKYRLWILEWKSRSEFSYQLFGQHHLMVGHLIKFPGSHWMKPKKLQKQTESQPCYWFTKGNLDICLTPVLIFISVGVELVKRWNHNLPRVLTLKISQSISIW